MLCVNWSLSKCLFCNEVIFRLSFTAYPAGIDNNDDGMKETKTLSNYQRVLDILQGDLCNYSAILSLYLLMFLCEKTFMSHIIRALSSVDFISNLIDIFTPLFLSFTFSVFRVSEVVIK